MSTQLGAAPASSPFDGRDASSRSASSRSRAWQAFRLSNQAVQASKPSLSGFGSRRTRSDSQTCQSSSSLSCAGSTPDERCVSWKPALKRTWRPPSKLSTSPHHGSGSGDGGGYSTIPPVPREPPRFKPPLGVVVVVGSFKYSFFIRLTRPNC